MKLQVNIAQFSNNELVTFGEHLNAIVKNLTGMDAVLTPFETNLSQCQQAMNSVLQKTMAKSVSALLKEEDNFRDNCLIGLNKLVDACEYHPDETVQTAATQLNALLGKLGSEVQNKSYDTESAIVKTLLTDMKSNYAGQVAAVNATAYITALDEAQTRFDTYRQQQLAENAAMSEIVSMSTIRREFESNIRNLLNLLPSYYLINPSPEVKRAINQVQELINKYK